MNAQRELKRPALTANSADPGITCVASSTHRARLEDNQDAAVAARLASDSSPVVLVADGLGGFARGGEAARFVTHMAQRLLEGREPGGSRPRNLTALFADVQERLARFACEQQEGDNEKDTLDPAKSWGTTLLAGVELPHSLCAAYVGNGGLFHLRGNFADFGPGLAPPWCCVNYLNPHTLSEQGREALYRYLAAQSAPGQAEPSVFALNKDARFGDLLLLCTDGIYSPDQVPCGDPGDGSVWSEIGSPLRMVLNALRACFCQPEPLSPLCLETALNACLENLRTQGQLEDDATLGLLVTARALAYQQEAHCLDERE